MGKEWYIVESTEMRQTTATYLEAAYAELTKTTVGTPEYDQALGAFLSLLFPDRNSPIGQQPTSNLPSA